MYSDVDFVYMCCNLFNLLRSYLILFVFNFELQLIVLHNFTLEVPICIQRIPEVEVEQDYVSVLCFNTSG